MFPICVPAIICPFRYRSSLFLYSRPFKLPDQEHLPGKLPGQGYTPGKLAFWRDENVFIISFCTEFLTVHSTNQAIYLSLIFLRGRDFSQNVFLYRNPSFNYNPFFPVYEIPYVITDTVVKVHE